MAAASLPTTIAHLVSWTCLIATISVCNGDSYTNWRYGDGQFHNALSTQQRLFTKGLLPSQVSNLSFSADDVNTNLTLNASNKILYPLITQNNEMFVLRLGGAHCVSKYDGQYPQNFFVYFIQTCDVQIIKLDADLVAVWNETLFSNLTCYNLQDYVPCINYPIYHTYNATSYVIVSFNNLKYGIWPNTTYHFSNFLQILNVTQISTSSSPSSQSAVIFNATYNSTAYFVFSVYPNQPVVHQDYVYYHYFPTINIGNASNYASYDMTHMVHRLSDGTQLWSSTVRNLKRFWDVNGETSWNYQLYRPVIGGDRVVMQQSNGLVAYDLWNGSQVWNAASIRAKQASACNAVVHHAYQVLFGCLYDIFDKDVERTYLFAVDLNSGFIYYSLKTQDNINALFLNEQQQVLLAGSGAQYWFHSAAEMRRYHIEYIGLTQEYHSNTSLFLAHSYFMDNSLLLFTQTLPGNPYKQFPTGWPRCYTIWDTAGSAFEPVAESTSNCDVNSAANGLNDDVAYFYPVVGNDNGLIYLISEQYQVQAFRAEEGTKHRYHVGLYVGIGVAAFCVLLCIVALVMYCKKKKSASEQTETQPMLTGNTKKSVNY